MFVDDWSLQVITCKYGVWLGLNNRINGLDNGLVNLPIRIKAVHSDTTHCGTPVLGNDEVYMSPIFVFNRHQGRVLMNEDRHILIAESVEHFAFSPGRAG